MPSPIVDVLAWEALDSRGRPTVACRVTTADGGTGRAIVPSGASTGSREAVELRDGDSRHSGWGVLKAVANANTILRESVLSMNAQDQEGVDAALESADGTPDLSALGANAVLAVSIASLLAATDASREPLWGSGGEIIELPMPMVNIISGGAHAGGAIDVQDVLVVPIGARSFSEAIEMVSAIRQGTASCMAERGAVTSLVADEGGLASMLRTNEEALELVVLGMERAGLAPGEDASIALDLAATQLAEGSLLALRSEQRRVSYEEWIEEVSSWVDQYPICSIEDVLPDTAWSAWSAASKRFNPRIQLVGDDLFATDEPTVLRGIEEGIANSVLVKLNQTGTVSRAHRTLRTAKAADYSTVISARSGDTEDHWLSDLAVAWHAGQIKVGSVMRSERTSKWNRLLEIEATTGAPLARFPRRRP